VAAINGYAMYGHDAVNIEPCNAFRGLGAMVSEFPARGLED
jgi:hypothetical protein